MKIKLLNMKRGVMLRNHFLILSLVLLGLLGGSNSAWGIGIGDLVGGIEDPSTWFYVRLNANVSTPACGSNPGEVKLSFSDIAHDPTPINPWITGEKPANPYNNDTYSDNAYNAWHLGIKDAIWDKKNSLSKYTTKDNSISDEESELHQYESTIYKDGYDAGWNWYDTYYKGPSATADQQHEMMMHFPVSPYTADAKNWWSDAFDTGERVAKGEESAKTESEYEGTTDWNDTIHYPVPASDNGWTSHYIYYIPNPYYQTYSWAGYTAGKEWYEDGDFLNPDDPTGSTGWGSSAALRGFAPIYAEGVEVPHMISTYAYFRGEARENDGWYFAGWSYTEGDYDLGGSVDESSLFKVLPSAVSGLNRITNRYVYATFKPVMVANYTVNGTIDVAPGIGNNGNNTIVFDVQGERLSTADFTVTATDIETDDDDYTGHGTCTPVITSVVDGKVTVTVTYTASDAVAGTYRCNITLKSKSGCSKLKAPVFARVANTSDAQASLYDGKVASENFVKSGSLTSLIAEASSEQVVALNKNYTEAISIGKDVTIDLNGYTLSNTLTVTAGNVTLAYSKYWGNITKTVTVNNGATLTLNGGRIIVEGDGGLVANNALIGVDVKTGGKLIQNGADIRVSVSQCYAIGINVAGETEVKDGNIAAHADMIAAFGAQVVAGGKLTTTGGSISSTVNQTNQTTEPTNNPATWSNAYAVYVSEETGNADIQGGVFNASSTCQYAFAVCALASEGKMTIGKNAVVSAHSDGSNDGVYAVGLLNSAFTSQTADVTINGGRFSATYTDAGDVTITRPILAGIYKSLTFNAGYFQTDSIYVRHNMFPQSKLPVVPQLYNLTYKGKDYMDGYRYLAVGNGVDTKAAGVHTARIGTTGYSSLAEALAYANNNRDKNVVIVLQNDDVLPAGYYTLPEKATLIIARAYEQETGSEIIPRVSSTSSAPTPYIQPYPYVTLTVANGANIDVYGTIEVSGMQRSTDGSYAAHPHGPCGFVNMQEGSRMTMQDGATLRAWGFIIGKGETDVRRGATVCEQFQMGDWKGGSTSFLMLSDTERRVFPLTHYYIQNIESPFKYHPGAILSTTTAVSATLGVTVTASANDIKVIGVNGRDQAMFLMDNEADAENTWVRKWYDVEHDLQVYEVNNSAHIGSMVLDLGKLGTTPLQMNSGFFVLPITCNMKIHLLSGFMDFTQNTALLPGAEVEVDKGSIVTVIKNASDDVLSGSLYVYDADQWDMYAYDESVNGGIKYTKPVQYAAGFGGKPTAREAQFYDKSKLKDATINVHGSFVISEPNCYLYTSTGEEPLTGGANIFSSNEDAGTFVVAASANSIADRTERVWQVKNQKDYNSGDDFKPASLKNKDGSLVSTVGTAPNHSIIYMDDAWSSEEIFYFDCYAATVDMAKYAQLVAQYGNTDPIKLGESVTHIYIKPQEWVEIAGVAAFTYTTNPYDPYLVGVTGNADHTYSDAAGTGRLFILLNSNQECQWWEVEKKDNLYHCIHPQNDTYYYWKPEEQDPDDPDAVIPAHWEEKKYTISWKNWDGTLLETIGPKELPVTSYEVTYGTMAEYLGTNPTREATIDYTYDFTGWSPTPGRVTSDVTYTATYTEKPRKYTIIFCQEGGVEIERHFLTHNEVPVCENVPTKVGHILQWSPAIAAVTGDATYTATWLEEPPTEFEIKFVDYDGTTELQKSNVAVGAMPEYTGATPTGKATWAESEGNKEFTYVFDHWSPTVTEVTQAMTYTAVYREQQKTYTIIFQDENEDEIERHNYTYGSTPVCANLPTKANTAEWTYKLSWVPQIETVRENATYKANFDALKTKNKYTVSAKCSPAGAATITGNGIYEYNEATNAVSITLTANAGFTFQGWQDLSDKTITNRTTAVTGDVNLLAVFTVAAPDYTITWMNENGEGDPLAVVGQKANTVTTYTGATPTKEATSAYIYTFDGWTTGANGTGTFYKNNQTPKATANATYFAHFAEEAIPSLEISSGTTVLTEPVEYQNLIISSDGVNSGELLGIDKLSLTGDAFFDFKVNMKTHTWYAVAVPWEVDLTDGGVLLNGRPLTITTEYDVIYYNGERRAEVGPQKTWAYETSTMHPGTLYLVALMGSAPNGLRFKAKSHNMADLMNTSASVHQYPESTENDGKDAGWNGVANPAIFQAFVNAGATVGQAFNSETGGYDVVPLQTTRMVVGQGVFIQAPADATVNVAYGASYNSSAPIAAAPRRAAEETNLNAYYEVRISPMEKPYTDRLFVQVNDDKEEDVYTIGKDLIKMGISDQKAQMWIKRYDTKLCLNAMKPSDDKAEFPLGIYVPETGDYTIGIKHEADEESSIYLTRDGEAIWNLSKGAYTTEMASGTMEQYGLRVIAKAPTVITGFDEAVVDSRDTIATKVLIGNQVYIIRGDEVYTITGMKVK